jgi:hypothetical protein
MRRFSVVRTGSRDHESGKARISRPRASGQITKGQVFAYAFDLVAHTCGQPPQRVVADSGFYTNQNADLMARRGTEAYVPDSFLARELNLGHPAREFPRPNPHLSRMRQRMRSPEGRKIYAQRKGMVEPVFGILKEQRGMRSFRMRGITKVETEFALAATAHNLTRMYRHG